MAEKLRRALPALLGLILFAVALLVLRKELHAVTWHELTSDVLATPPARILVALVLTALNYLVLDRLRPAGLRVRREALVALARGRGLVPRLRDRQQRRLRHALGRRRALPLLHALGRHRPGALADRVLVLDHLLAGAPRARRHQPRGEPPSGRPRAPGARARGPRGLAAAPDERRPTSSPCSCGASRSASGGSSCRCRPRGSASRSSACRPSTGRSPPRCSTCCCRRATCRSRACWAPSSRRSSSASPATCRAASASSRA